MIGIAFLTYNRLAVARRCMEALGVHLQASEPLWFHLADDGSSQDYRDELAELARTFAGNNFSMSNSERTGYGGNYNEACQVLHRIADIVLPLEDDWEIIRDFNLDPIAKVLRDGLFGCVRMAYIGYTAEIRATFRWGENLQWLELDPESSEKHIWTGGPRLETVEWQRAVGPWLEGLEQGQTELEVSSRPASRHKVAWPISLIHPRGDVFVHVGSEKADLEGLKAVAYA